MKPSRYILPAVLVAGVLCTHVWAQERSATGARDVQSSWTALKTMIASTKAAVADAGLKIIALNTRMDGYTIRLDQINSDIGGVNGRVDSAEISIQNLRDQLDNLAMLFGELNQKVTEQGMVITRVINCSAKEKYFVATSPQWAGKCNGESTGDPEKTKVTKTFSIGNNDCGDQGCLSTAATAKKLCQMRNYEGLQGNATSAYVTALCGQTITAKGWDNSKSSWEWVTVTKIRFGDSGCMGNITGINYIRSVTCYKYQ